jgi:16S rRNA (guanine527-N7)-methyltransferase
LELIKKYFPHLSKRQLEQMAALEGLYGQWNTKINVISRKDIGGLYEKHVLHSLSIAKVFEFEPGTSVIDIGTGGGFPGIPLAICFPETGFHLVDAVGKKIKVALAVAGALQLKNVTTQHARAETLRPRSYDVAVSRAVAPLKDLALWSRPLLRKNAVTGAPGRLICLKGGDLSAEIATSGTHPHIYPVSSYFGEPWFREKYVVDLPFA